MGLFSFFQKNRTTVGQPEQDSEKITIPRELFVEDAEPNGSPQFANGISKVTDLNAIYAFLQQDYESRGYSDALTNAEESYKRDNLELINLDLQILIEKARSSYEHTIAQIELHIQTRSRSGLVDLVEELKSRRETLNQDIQKIDEIEEGMANSKGLAQRAMLSYSRGFLRGLTAITQSKLLN